MTNSLLNSLNPDQQICVLETEGYIRIIAGAGSGKTKVLTHRYAHLVQNLGIPTKSILCVTFTNKAAQEMKVAISPNASVNGLKIAVPIIAPTLPEAAETPLNVPLILGS